MVQYNLHPIRIEIPQAEIDHFHRILEVTRLPNNPIIPGADDQTSKYGTRLVDLRDAREKLLKFDWRKFEADINRWKHYTVEIEETRIHFIHEKSTRANAIPLLLLHGWPFSFLEYKHVIDPLINPPPGQQAFHVVVASLPGIFLSSVVPNKEHSTPDVARIFNTLMVDVLGYEEYGAQGGDFGAINLRQIQLNHYKNCKLILFTGFPAPRPSNFTDADIEALPDYEKRLLEGWERYQTSGTGYFVVQTTDVASIGYAVYDGIGMASWLVGKYILVLQAACAGKDFDENIYLDELANLLLYQYTHSAHTSMLMYQQSGRKYTLEAFTKRAHGSPMGVSLFEGEFFLAPKSWIEEIGDLVFHKYHKEGGGHIPGLVQPQLLVDDLRELFSKHWKHRHAKL